jgi:hypothetical protein
MRKTLLAVTLVAVACGKKDAPGDAKPDTTSTTASPPSVAVVQAQSAPSDPCGWISRADAEKALGEALLSAPTRVRSAETPVEAPNGSACRYDLASSGPLKRSIAIELNPDESGVMQTAFMGMGSVEQEFKGKEAEGDTLIAGRWDFLSAIPGGLTAAKKGRIAAMVTASMGTGDKGMALAAAMVDRIPDLPFTADPADLTAPPHDPDPCALITRQEAEAVLGPLAVAPYRSRKNTALVYGSGPSCSYFTGKHRALVVTPMYRLGADMFRMMGGADRLVEAKLGGTAAPDTLEGAWDQLGLGSDGTLHVLKGDKMLSLQFKASAANFDKAVMLVRSALTRF